MCKSRRVFKIDIDLQNSASIQPRKSLSKFAKNYQKLEYKLEKTEGGAEDEGKRDRLDPSDGEIRDFDDGRAARLVAVALPVRTRRANWYSHAGHNLLGRK